MAESKTVLVTGASSGFGRLTAEELARRGHSVWASLRDPDRRNRDVAHELREADIQVLEIDVTSGAAVSAAVDQIVHEAGTVDVAINNAGVGYVGIAEAFSVAQLQEQLDINVTGAFRVLKAVLPHMRAQRTGLIVQLSSVLGRVTIPFSGLYCASKFAVEALAEAVRYELSACGVDVVIVEPGAFQTRFADNLVWAANQSTANEYGMAVNGALRGLVDAFDSLYADPQLVTDPAVVAERIADLVDQPNGERPFRVAVGSAEFGIGALNEAAEPFRLETLKALQMEHMEGVRAASAATASLSPHAG